MGASGSKAAQQTVRKFPTRAPGSSPAATTNPTARASPRPPRAASDDAQPSSQPRASYTKDDAIRADSTNPNSSEFSPDFVARLQKMGIVQPNPTYSPSSIASPFSDASGINQSVSAPRFPSSSSNRTLGVLEVRRQLEARAKEELENMGKSTDKGREFLDIGTVRQILVLRQGGVSPADIESRLRLKPGVVAKLGPQGVVAPA
ncbi:hypothetical protein C7999DRAFT_11043 [Corynascus novoguineensis]|uniref:Helix-turn-helix domain-containing protein n=1 Tax=Corynascus novoguineensis TaxID=1126955 RepID=A0AAN7HUA0_9PEZI|nr:hypothetical protein C7999DRAFT_11043 [Corynascus novoguineensis]